VRLYGETRQVFEFQNSRKITRKKNTMMHPKLTTLLGNAENDSLSSEGRMLESINFFDNSAKYLSKYKKIILIMNYFDNSQNPNLYKWNKHDAKLNARMKDSSSIRE
jgi:hypothetical protein